MSDHMNNQTAPSSKTYLELISDVKKRIIKVLKFQLDLLLNLNATASMSSPCLNGCGSSYVLYSVEMIEISPIVMTSNER